MSIIGMRNKMSHWGKSLMLILAATFVVGFIGMTLGGKLGGPGSSTRETGVIAKVNGQKLQWQDFQAMVKKQTDQYEQMGQPLGPANEIQIHGQIFDDMVSEAMWVQAAKKEGVRVSRGDVNKKIDEYTDMQMKSLREQVLRGRKKKTDAVFEAQLAKMEPGMSISKKRAEIRKYFQGVAPQIRNSLMIEKLNKKIDDSVSVSDRAVEESYDSAAVSQITVASTGKRSDEQARKRADEIVAKLRKGDDFTAIAKSSSDDMYAQFGGNRGPVQRTTAEPELKDAIFRLKAGEISDPIKTDKGYVILKSAGVAHNVPPDFNDPKKKREYKDQYAQQARQTARADYEKKLRKEMKLDIFDAELKAYAAFKDGSMQMMSMDNAGRKKALENIIRLYQEAIVEAGDQTDAKARCYSQLAMLYNIMKSSPMFGLTKAEQGKYGKLTIEALKNALDNTEDIQLRMTLSRLSVEAKDKTTAAESLAIAMDTAYDAQTYEQIRDMYKQIGLADKAAEAQKKVDELKTEQAASGAPGSVTSQPIQVPAGGGQ